MKNYMFSNHIEINGYGPGIVSTQKKSYTMKVFVIGFCIVQSVLKSPQYPKKPNVHIEHCYNVLS